jgi:hypothetical protein
MIDFTNKLAHLYPEFSVYRWYMHLLEHHQTFRRLRVGLHLLISSFRIRIQEDKQDWVVRAKDPSKKLINLGVRFTPLDKTIADTMDCFRSKGLI